VERASSTNDAKKLVYVRLLDEGTDVYRPVSALLISEDEYLLLGEDIYDPEDEHWEFPPGARVRVNRKNVSGELILVATGRCPIPS